MKRLMYTVTDSSVYDAHILHQRRGSVPTFLQPADLENGWIACRSLLKALNALPMLRRKGRIYNLLAPVANTSRVRREASSDHSSILEPGKECGRKDSLSAQLSHSNSGALSARQTESMLEYYATVSHMEFHPTDCCNLRCIGCTYGHDSDSLRPSDAHFPFPSLPQLKRLNPKSMVIVGGGEPTLWRWHEYRFADLVAEIVRLLPRTQLALVTNGTYIPKGDWPKHFKWIRVSVDAASRETFAAFRGRDMLPKVLENYLAYLSSPVKCVGLGFLFARSNVHEYAAFARFVYELVSQRAPDRLAKVNIQYRPLRVDPARSGSFYDERVSDGDIESVIWKLKALTAESPGFAKFLKFQTNAAAILGGNEHVPHSFEMCFYGQTFKIVRANGGTYPCFVRVLDSRYCLGNLITDSLASIGRRTMVVCANAACTCSPEDCRQSHVNYVMEQGLKRVLRPSESSAIRDDPMY